MPIVNNLTTNFSWPLPNQANFLSDDVTRLITTIQSIDTTLYAIQVTHNNTPVTLASASTVNIGAAASDNIIISGTTTITAFDNVNNGIKRWVRFSGALTLTYNATSLILPGAANISTAANDTAEFISLGGGNWQCIRYTKASVAPYSGAVSGGITWTKKTSAYTANDKDGVMADTSGGAWILKLPSSPTAGMQVYIVDNAGSWATNNLTVDPQDATIASQSAGATLVMDVKGAYVAFVHDGTNWDVYSLANSSSAVPSGILKGLAGAITTAAAETDYVTPSGSGTLANKTLTNPTVTGYTETVYTLATSGTVNLNPANGTVQSCAASAGVTFTDSLSAGQSILLMLANGSSYTITWPTITWVSSSGNVVPTLSAGNTIVFWKIGSTLYGAMVGKYA